MKGDIKLKVKTIMGYSVKEFDNKVNEFLLSTSLDIVEVKYSSNIFFHSAMIIYK